MTESIRPHERIPKNNYLGKHLEINDIFESPAHLFIPTETYPQDSVCLLIHFHGSHEVADYAIKNKNGWAALTLNLGSGSSAYSRPLDQVDAFHKLLKATESTMRKPIKAIYLSGWSAGYGAIRSILKSNYYSQIDGVLLLDGMHAGYIPKGQPLATGAKINEEDLSIFLQLAQDAIKGNIIFTFTHSSVFPGTFASTTECADYLINQLELKRNPVLIQGPLGMQQVADNQEGSLRIKAYAGNSAPDHVDHLHALSWFLEEMTH
ncbi:hypothetical protein [Echinicola shivajiensis]|uniref:hypothetical protein n=1 Tax=Echinicola shivajiensis TaxID=1035916 RepID=UPI001FE89AE7|nr:hypothetical protein [Echinicola shivajiensis]